RRHTRFSRDWSSDVCSSDLAAVPSGETIVLAGLITDGSERGSSGIPGLSRIPVIGGLFGQQGASKTRDELVVLITPTVVRSPQEIGRASCGERASIS